MSPDLCPAIGVGGRGLHHSWVKTAALEHSLTRECIGLSWTAGSEAACVVSPPEVLIPGVWGVPTSCPSKRFPGAATLAVLGSPTLGTTA